MTAQPPEDADDINLVELALQAVDDHPPGLHPIDLISGARRGFTADQGHAVLGNADLLAFVARQWRSRAPSGAVPRAAQETGVRGQVHLRLLDRTGQLISLRSRSQYGLAAGTSRQGPEVLVDDNAVDHGVVVVRRVYKDQGLLDIVVESQITADSSFPVVGLYSLTEDGLPQCRLLFLLAPTPPGHALASHSESRLRVDATLTSDRLSLFALPVQASDLSESLLALVSHSVAMAKLPWKEAWRRAALSTEEGHPLRAAVVAGLAAHT